MRKSTTDFFAGLFMLIVAGIFYHQSAVLDGLSLLFPRMLVIFLTLGSIVLLVQGMLLRQKSNDTAEGEAVAVSRVAQISLGSMVYVGAIPLLGFYPATAVFLLLMGMFLNDAGTSTRKAAVSAAAFTVVLSLCVWFGFAYLLSVPTPQSIFLE